MDAYKSRLLGDGSLRQSGQMLRWMDFRVSQLLRSLFDRCDIINMFFTCHFDVCKYVVSCSIFSSYACCGPGVNKNLLLSMDPWWSPIFTSNSWLKRSPTRTWLRALAYIPWTNRTIHSSTPSFLRADQITFRETRSNAFSRTTKAI